MTQNVQSTRYSDADLAAFKVLIESKLDHAKQQLAFYLGQLEELAQSDDSKIRGLDDGIGTAENERLNTMAARQRKHIKHLENAIIRIHNKSYGVCRESGKLISKKRLMAVPHATLSIEAKLSR